MKLLTTVNAKTSKGESLGYLTGILYLSPAELSGVNLCPWSTAGCRAACLNTAGRGRFDSIQDARLIKTIHFLSNRAGFIEQLSDDIDKLKSKARREGLIPCIRLNGTSDIVWERVAPELFLKHHDIQFYDYTKAPIGARGTLPSNYHLTRSASEKDSLSDILSMQSLGHSIALVCEPEFKLLLDALNVLYVNGDENDLRFLDKAGTIVLLTPKGRAKKELSNFIRRQSFLVA